MGEDFPAVLGCDVARHGGFGRCHESAADIKHARPLEPEFQNVVG